MASLKWDQIAAPNLTGASDILRNANTSFNNGFDALGSTLEGARTRRQERVSNSVIPELAGVQNEAQMPAFLQQLSQNVAPQDMSPELRDAVLGMRKGVADVGLTRSQTAAEGSKAGLYDAQGNLYNAQAAGARGDESRTGIDFGRRIASEDQLMDQAGAIVGAREGAIGGNFGIGYQNSGAPNNSQTNSFDYIASKEGFEENTYYDVDAERGGFGSDTVTRADGTVVPVTKGMKISREDATRDLNRRIETEFRPAVVKAVGTEVYNGMNSTQQSAVDSITYNYGAGFWDKGYAKPIAAALRNGDFEAAAQGIESLKGHNEGINAGRRQEEANMLRMAGGNGNGQASNANFQSGLAELASVQGNAVSPEKWLELVQGNQTAFGVGQAQRQNDRTSDLNYSNDVRAAQTAQNDVEIARQSLSAAQQAAETSYSPEEARTAVLGMGLAPELEAATLAQLGEGGQVDVNAYQTPINAAIIPNGGAIKTSVDTANAALDVAAGDDKFLRINERAKKGLGVTESANELITELGLSNTEAQVTDAIKLIAKEERVTEAVAYEFLKDTVRGSNIGDFQWMGTGANYRDAGEWGGTQIDIEEARKAIQSNWTPQARRDAETRSSRIAIEREELATNSEKLNKIASKIQLAEERKARGQGDGPTEEMIQTRNELSQQLMDSEKNSLVMGSVNGGGKDNPEGDDTGSNAISAALDNRNSQIGLDGRQGITPTMNESLNMVDKLTGQGAAILAEGIPAEARLSSIQTAMANVADNPMVPPQQKEQIMRDLGELMKQLQSG